MGSLRHARTNASATTRSFRLYGVSPAATSTSRIRIHSDTSASVSSLTGFPIGLA